MNTSRELDENGFLLVKGCPISSFGIFDYSAGQLGLPGDPNRIVKVYRPESAVSDPEAIKSFMNVPLINDHEMLSGFKGDKGATAPEDYGVSGVLTSNVYYAAPWMRGDLKVFSREMQQLLQSGKKDLSLGYSCDFELTPGIFEGQAYEVVQTNMRGNHIALVDEGRVPGARVLDGLCFDHLRFDVIPSDRETAMSKKVLSKKTVDNAVAQLKALLPALEQYLNEEGKEPEHQDGSNAGEADPTMGASSGANPAGDPNAAAGDPTAGDPSAAGADPATSGDPSATGEAAAQSDPASAQGNSELTALVSKVEAVLAELKAACGGAANGAGDDKTGTDKIEGLNPTVDEIDPNGDPAQDADPAGVGTGQGKASPGPNAGSNATANDASLQRFYSDLAAKDRVYNRLSKVVGTFDCKAMDARGVNAYGVKKLNIACTKGQESIALDAYLSGIEAANKATKTRIQAKAADSNQSTAELDAYIRGE